MSSDLPTDTGGLNVIQGSGTFQATGEVVGLGREADRERVSVDDEIKRRDADLREWMADRIVPAFTKANGFTLVALGVLWLVDELNLVFHVTAPSGRIITSQVIMALLGATTAQVGTIAVIIARYLFPGR